LFLIVVAVRSYPRLRGPASTTDTPVEWLGVRTSWDPRDEEVLDRAIH
jgi:hypothetical protein